MIKLFLIKIILKTHCDAVNLKVMNIKIEKLNSYFWAVILTITDLLQPR
jgi:hypothetical protein